MAPSFGTSPMGVLAVLSSSNRRQIQSSTHVILPKAWPQEVPCLVTPEPVDMEVAGLLLGRALHAQPVFQVMPSCSQRAAWQRVVVMIFPCSAAAVDSKRMALPTNTPYANSEARIPGVPPLGLHATR